MTTISPEKECPRWDQCSVNHCPLEVEQDRHLRDAGDKQTKCPMEKGVRHRIGSKYPDLLPMLGLTPREWLGKQLWDKKPAAERAAMAERGKTALLRLRTDSNGKNGKTTQI